MGKEKITYEQMIDLLKSNHHKAPVSWTQIESALDLTQGISGLPTYKAPDNLWAGIEQGLGQMKPEIEVIEPQLETIKKLRSYNGIYILIASILFFVSTIIAVKFLSQNNKDDGYQYRSEVEMASLDENKVILDDNIDDVLIYIENNSYMFTDDQLKEFNNQLAEINAALTKLMDMQEKYGMDASSNKMMARMERDKANLLKSMISNS